MATVAGFTKYDIINDQTVRSRFKMRVSDIEATSDLVKIDGTEEEVPDELLDGNGRYFPDA